jgi:tetratricopeptide (TPR) repeat protein
VWGLALGAATLFAVLIAAASGLSMLTSRGTVHRVTPEAEVATELRLQRDAAQGLADAYNRLQARYEGRKMDEDELFELALAHVAEEATVSQGELQQTLAAFATAVNESPNPEALDLALVAFSERDFKRAVPVPEAVPVDSEEQRELLRMRGQCLLASKDPGGAVDSFQAALRATSLANAPEVWADLQFRIGEASVIAGSASDLLTAEEAFSSAFEVLDQDLWSTQRGIVLNELAACQTELLKLGVDDDLSQSSIVSRFEEIIENHRAAADILYSASEWRWWAQARADLAEVLVLAGSVPFSDARGWEILDDKHLFEAASWLRKALRVQDGTEPAAELERTRRLLAETLFLRALLRSDDRKASLFEVCSLEYDQAFARLEGDARSYLWYRLARSKAVNWRRMADTQGQAVKVELLETALELEISIAEYFEGETEQNAQVHSQHWVAWSQLCLVDAQGDSAEARARSEDLLVDAERRLRFVLAAPEHEDQSHSRMPAQQNLAGALHRRANLKEGPERIRLLTEAIQEAERYLDLYRSQMTVNERDSIALWIESMELELPEGE